MSCLLAAILYIFNKNQRNQINNNIVINDNIIEDDNIVINENIIEYDNIVINDNIIENECCICYEDNIVLYKIHTNSTHSDKICNKCILKITECPICRITLNIDSELIIFDLININYVYLEKIGIKYNIDINISTHRYDPDLILIDFN